MKKIALITSSFALVAVAACQQQPTAEKTELVATVAQTEGSEAPKAAPAEDSFVEVTPDQVEGWLAEKAKVAVIDANSDSTREAHGVVPGAVLLTSYREMQPEELPADKSTKLVFYCGGTSCSASDKAAVKAAAQGYDDVCVMREGIRGWAKAGKKTLTLAEARKGATAQAG